MILRTTSAAPDYSTVLSTADLKAHLRVTHSVEDTLIASLRDAACIYVEGYCNTKMHETDAIGYLPGFQRAVFPVGPDVEITDVRYQTTSSTANADCTVLNSANWWITPGTTPAVIDFVNAPNVYQYTSLPVQIAFSYGHSSPPDPMVHAVRLLAAHLYENRQEVTDRSSYQMKVGVEALLSQFRNILQP